MFKAILLINIGSILVVTLFNYFVFHRMGNNAYLDSFVQYNGRVTNLAFTNIDNQIMQSVFRISQLHFSPIEENASFFLLQEKEEADSPENIRAFVTQMDRLEHIYPFIKSMDIYYEATGIAVTGFDKVHYPESEERLDQYLPWYEAYKRGNTSRGFLDGSYGAYTIKEPVLTYVERITQPRWNGNGIVVAMHISPSVFGDYIDEKEGALTVMAKDGHIIYDTPPDDSQRPLTGDMFAQMEALGIGLDGEMNPFSMTVGSEHMTVFYEVSPDSGLVYVYRIANNRFYEEYNAARHIFILNFVISIGFNILMLLVVSYYNYAAYRKRVREISEGAGIVLNQEERGFDASLRVLTKEITSLHETVNSSKGLIFQSTVRSLLLSKNAENTYEEIEAYLKGDSACVFFFHLAEGDSRYLSVERLQEEFPPDVRPYEVLFTTLEKDGLVAVLLWESKTAGDAPDAFVEEMDRYWENVSIASGQTVSIHRDGIRTGCKSAVEAARYRFILPDEKWITYDSLQIGKRKGSGSHLKLFDMIEKDLRSGDLLDLKVRIEGMVVSCKSGNYTIDYCNSTLRDMVTLFYRFMQQNQLDMWVVFGYDIREYYKQIPDIDAFHVWLDDLCEVILRNIRQKKESIDPGIRQRIEELIEVNLEGNISLDLLSDELHMRPDAVSRMFRQVMGKGYAEYVKERKMNRAIILMGKGRSIKETAEQLGYSSAQYFIKVFKESYGITPYQYMKQQKRE